jgi:hypothetical protein
MECVVIVETEADQTLLVHGSYHAAYRLYDKLIVTDRDTYIFDILAGTLRTADGTVSIESEQDNAARVIYEFFERNADIPRSSGPGKDRSSSANMAGKPLQADEGCGIRVLRTSLPVEACIRRAHCSQQPMKQEAKLAQASSSPRRCKTLGMRVMVRDRSRVGRLFISHKKRDR